MIDNSTKLDISTDATLAGMQCCTQPFLNRFVNSNCLDLIKDIADETIDLTITSPPYNLGVKHHTGNNVFEAYDEYIDDMPKKNTKQNK
jgi:DNA modification methylase